MISFLFDGLILGQVSQIVILGLKIPFSEFSLNALLKNRVVFDQHLSVVLLKHRKFMR